MITYIYTETMNNNFMQWTDKNLVLFRIYGGENEDETVYNVSAASQKTCWHTPKFPDCSWDLKPFTLKHDLLLLVWNRILFFCFC